MKLQYFLVIFVFFLCVGPALTACDDDDDDDDDDVSGDTWNDPSTGYTWQVTPSSGFLDWKSANSYCNNLSLDGGGWHLPTISELRTLIRGCEYTATGGSCGVTDDCLDYSCMDDSCFLCDYDQGPNNGCFGPEELPGECNWYWSSSTVVDHEDDAFGVHFDNGSVSNMNDSNDDHARCVRW